MSDPYTLTLSCQERPGIVHAVSSFLFEHGCDIVEHQQFDDAVRGQLFLRTAFVCSRTPTPTACPRAFGAVADEFGMTYQMTGDQPRGWSSWCPSSATASTTSSSAGVPEASAPSSSPWSPTTRTSVRWPRRPGLPFLHVPVTPTTKRQAEERLLELVDEHRADLVVLARYMQVLSDEACAALHGRAINIHHSFLPGFKGAKPYHQAFDRGVKLVGATAHYVTPDLDEGPIIEQEVIRIDHTFDPRALATVGQDAEALALSRAVRWHSERRVLLNGHSTVVFR